MKTFKKAELTFKNGYIFAGDEIVSIDNRIVKMANNLESLAQRAEFEAKQPKPTPVSNEEFERVSEFDHKINCVASTPELDKLTEQSLKIMDEIDSVEMSNKVNEFLELFNDLVLFVNEDFIIEATNQNHQERFDLPTLGNPLEWEDKTFVDVAIAVVNA